MMKVVQEEDLDFLQSCSEPIAEFSDLGSADAIAGLLAGEKVRAKVEPVGLVAGLPRGFRVLVEPRQLHRARWVLEQSDISDAELTYLATGRLASESD